MVSPLGCHLGGQNGTKIDPKTIKNRREKSRGEKTDPRRSWIRLEAILGRFGTPSWEKKRLKPFVLNGFVKIHFFDVKTVRRRSWDQLWPTKAPKRAKMTPKRDPRSTPKRPKIDIKIDMIFDANSRGAWRPTGRRLWAGTPPRELPGGAPGTQGRRPRPHGTSKKS